MQRAGCIADEAYRDVVGTGGDIRKGVASAAIGGGLQLEICQCDQRVLDGPAGLGVAHGARNGGLRCLQRERNLGETGYGERHAFRSRQTLEDPRRTDSTQESPKRRTVVSAA
jgi:hypothetical protein